MIFHDMADRINSLLTILPWFPILQTQKVRVNSSEADQAHLCRSAPYHIPCMWSSAHPKSGFLLCLAVVNTASLAFNSPAALIWMKSPPCSLLSWGSLSNSLSAPTLRVYASGQFWLHRGCQVLSKVKRGFGHPSHQDPNILNVKKHKNHKNVL